MNSNSINAHGEPMHRIGPATLKGTHRSVCSYRLSQIRRSHTSAPAAVQAGTPGTPAGVPSLCRSLFRLRFRRRRDSRHEPAARRTHRRQPQPLGRTRRPRKEKESAVAADTQAEKTKICHNMSQQTVHATM